MMSPYFGNGATQGYSYSTQGDLLTLAHALSGAANTYTNTFTKAHQLASDSASNAGWQFVPAVFQTTAYSPANNLNQYVNVTVGANPAATMAYDANGNLTGDGVWTFAYDAQNMLRQAAKAGTTAAYAYDPLGRRQAKTVNAAVTTFLHDGDEEIADYDGANTVLRRYVPGPGTDMPIAMVTPAGGGTNTHSYFHTNRQGSTVAMSADNGTVAEGPYTYDAYGNGAPTTGVPFKYTGRRLDPETGLYYYRARYYSASLGRFLQVDPVGYGPDFNLYVYVKSDPLNLVDPSGLTDVNLYTDANEGPRWRAIGDGFDIPGMFTVGAHGSKPGQGMPNPWIGPRSRATMDPWDLAQRINQSAPIGSSVFLLACNFGRDPVYPEALSRATDRTVWAPDNYTWVSGDPNGQMTVVVAGAKNNDLGQGMDPNRSGSWREYSGGTATGRQITNVKYNAKTGAGSYTIKGDPRSILHRRDQTVRFKCTGSGTQTKCN